MIFLAIYIIYSLVNVNRIKYVSVNDLVMNGYNDYIKNYLNNSNRLDTFNDYFNSSSILDLYQDIKNNRTIKVNNVDYYLKKALRESDVLVISVGMEELARIFNKFDMANNYAYFNNMFSNIKRMIQEVKRYTYGKIIYFGYYNPTNYYDAEIDRFFYDINIKLERLMINNDIIYIDLYEMIKGNNYKEKDSAYLNNDGNKRISNVIEYYLK